MYTKKKLVSVAIGITSALVLTVTAFATNCGGGNFGYDLDYGTSLPYDDAEAYTSCSPSSIHQSDIKAWVTVALWNGNFYRSGGSTTYQRGLSSYNTGWCTLTGYDTITGRRHKGDVECIQTGCDGKNTLDFATGDGGY